MKSDKQIQTDVMEELKWVPQLNAAEIGVGVKNGIVTLSGEVNAYSNKINAENAAKKVAGVKAVVENIRVGITGSYIKTDAEIAEAVLNTLKWHTAIPENSIKIKVENGIVRLDGELEWEYQRYNAQSAIEQLVGVKSVINCIKLSPKLNPVDIQKKITAAFQRSATIDASKVKVEVNGTVVTLKGSVQSFAEKEEAVIAAWQAPGVTSVTSEIDINLPEYAFEE